VSTKDGDLRQIFRSHLPKFHWQSVESPLTGKGTPDSNYCFDGIEGWIEYKQTDSLRKIKSIKPEQVAWAERRARAGGRVFMAVRARLSSGTMKGEDQLWMIRARAIRRAFSSGLSSFEPGEAVSFRGGPGGWDWGMISLILTSNGL